MNVTMNNSLTNRWALAPRSEQDLVGAALRRAVELRCEGVPAEFHVLLGRLDRRVRSRVA